MSIQVYEIPTVCANIVDLPGTISIQSQTNHFEKYDAYKQVKKFLFNHRFSLLKDPGHTTKLCGSKINPTVRAPSRQVGNQIAKSMVFMPKSRISTKKNG